MKFLEIALFEIDYRLHRISTWVFLVVFAVLAMMVSTGMLVEEAQRAGDLHANGPVSMAVGNIITGMFGLVITASLFSGAALRDIETRMHPLFAASPITKADYLLGRFTGAFIVNVLLISVVPLALMLFTGPAFIDPTLLGPFRLAAYVQPYFFFLLPNVFFTGALLFAVAMITRRSLPVFAAGAFVFFAALLIEEVVAESFARGELAALIEPFGFSVISELWEFWTPFERNTRLMAFEGALMWNRILWFCTGVTILGLTTWRFRMDLHHVRGRQRRIVETGDERHTPVRMSTPVMPSFDLGTRVRQTLAITGETFRELVLSRDFLLISVALMGMGMLLSAALMSDNFGTPYWPLTQFIAPGLGSFLPAAVMSLLIAFYAGELVHREREAGLGDIADANPVPDWALFFGKFATLALMAIALQAVLMLSGLLLQAGTGFFNFEPVLYLQVIFGVQLPGYLIFAALAMLVHVLVDNKYFGHLIAVLLYFVTAFASRFGFEHNLLVYGGDSGVVYSDVSGFGPFLGPFYWFKLYWAGWAILLIAIGNVFWLRGRDRNLRKRVRLARRRFDRATASMCVAGALIVMTVGGFIYYNTNVLSEYRTSDEAANLRAEYERRYGKYENVPQPTVRRTKLHVEIYPERRVTEVRGTYGLLNTTAEPVRRIHLFLNPEVETHAVQFDRPNKMVLADRELGHRTYELATALAPGQWMQMTFDVRFIPRGFPNSDINTSVVQNGTYFDHTGGRNPNHRRWLPLIGYQPNRELSAARDRGERGLPPRPLAASLDAISGDNDSAGRESIDFEATIGTAANQTAIAPGTLRRTWTQNGRRYFHYASEKPIKNAFAVLSADYKLHEEKWNDVRLQLFYHPAHEYNVQRIARAARMSLEYFTKNFGPYPHKHLRIAEFPKYGHFAHAYPGLVSYAEGIGWLTRVDESQHFDLPTAVAAHEVAHQWWGHQVSPASVEGAGMLSEVLAQYSALMVVEKIYGREMADRFLSNTRIEYLNRRGRPDHPEVPLLFVSVHHGNLVYRKGPLAMYALRHYIGEEPLNAALRRFFAQHSSGLPPYPTSRDLYRELKAATPPAYHYLLEDLLETLTLWNLRTTAVTSEPLTNGMWRVHIDVEAHKLRADGTGKETEVPMNDFIDIGVYSRVQNVNEVGPPLYVRKHRIRSGPQRITVVVKGEPGKAGIDPDLHLIDRTWFDNLRPVLRSGK